MLERLKGFIRERSYKPSRRWPCAPGSVVTGLYGWQDNPLYDGDETKHPKRRFHTGIDIDCFKVPLDGKMTPLLLACEDGYVIWRSELHPTWGNVVGVAWKSGAYSVYCHMASPPDKIGKEYAAGEVVGIQGHTGLGVNDHLHFQVMTEWVTLPDGSPRFGNFDPAIGKHIDPLEWLPRP